MVSCNLVNIGSSNGLIPDGNKPLPEPVLTFHQWGIVAFSSWGPKADFTRHARKDDNLWYDFEDKKSSIQQPRRNRWHRKLSQRQITVPLVKTKLLSVVISPELSVLYVLYNKLFLWRACLSWLFVNGSKGFQSTILMSGTLQWITPDNNLPKLHKRSSSPSKISHTEKGGCFLRHL